jgi:hypothetical protein
MFQIDDYHEFSLPNFGKIENKKRFYPALQTGNARIFLLAPDRH